MPIRASWLLAMVCLATAPGRAVSPTAPTRIVLVTVDGARAGLDAWPAVAPEWAALARKGVRLRYATTPIPITFPATACLLTGCDPRETAIHDESQRGLDERVPALAAVLSHRGYATAAFPCDRADHRRSGLDRGFDRYEAHAAWLADSARVDSALAVLASPGRRFVWLGLGFGQPPEPWRRILGSGLRDSTAYVTRVAAIDASLGRLVRGLERTGGWYATLLVVVGTHGESIPGLRGADPIFAEDPLPGRGLDLSDDVLRVPLVLRGSGVVPRATPRAEPWVSTLDVAPTLAEAAGARPSGAKARLFGRAGVSLWPLIDGGALAPRVLRHECDAQRLLGVRPRTAARDGARKLLAYGAERRELLARPGAVAPAGSSIHSALARALGPQASSPAGAAAESLAREDGCVRELLAALPPRDAAIDSAGLERLLALRDRYPRSALAALECAVAASKSGIDDAAAWGFVHLGERRADLAEATIAYADHLRRHRHLELITNELAKVATDSPLAVEVAWREAIAHTARLDFEAARAGFDHAVRLGAPPDSTWYRLGATVDRAMAARDRARSAPDDPKLQIAYGRVLGELGLYEQCYQALHAARILNPQDPEADTWLGRYLLEQGKPEPAYSAFERALEADRDDVAALQGSAEALWAQQRPAAAIPFLRRVIEREPGDARARYNLACVLAASGDLAGAEAALGEAVSLGYSDAAQIAADPDLARLRDRPAFAQALDRARAAARARRQP